MNLVEDVVVVDFVFILGKACYQKQSEVAQSCPTLCNPMNCSMPGFPVLHYPPEFAETHVHCGEGSGTPLQYSCLENPMDGGAW